MAEHDISRAREWLSEIVFELFNIAEDVAKDIVMMYYEIGQIHISIISIIRHDAFLGLANFI